MRKFGRATIQSIIVRALQEFMNDESAPDFVTFTFRGHIVNAQFEWSPLRCAYYLSNFDVVYSRSVMRYNVNEDYDICFAFCW